MCKFCDAKCTQRVWPHSTLAQALPVDVSRPKESSVCVWSTCTITKTLHFFVAKLQLSVMFEFSCFLYDIFDADVVADAQGQARGHTEKHKLHHDVSCFLTVSCIVYCLLPLKRKCLLKKWGELSLGRTQRTHYLDYTGKQKLSALTRTNTRMNPHIFDCHLYLHTQRTHTQRTTACRMVSSCIHSVNICIREKNYW